jgi:hypothetical protein
MKGTVTIRTSLSQASVVLHPESVAKSNDRAQYEDNFHDASLAITCDIAAEAPSGKRMAFTPAARATGLLSLSCRLLIAKWQATSEEEHAVLVGMQGPVVKTRRNILR